MTQTQLIWRIAALLLALALGIGMVVWLGRLGALAVAVACAIGWAARKHPVGLVLVTFLLSGSRGAGK